MLDLRKDKKGNVVDTLKLVGTITLVLLVVAVLAIAAFITIVSLSTGVTNSDTSVTSTLFTAEQNGTNVTNATYGGVYLTDCNSHAGGSIISVTAKNSSTTLTATNYTTSGCLITASSGTYMNRYWNISYTYQYKIASESYNQVSNNLTMGITGFFAQVPTIFTILGVVILIAAVVLIIYFVVKMGGSGRNSTVGL